MEDWAKLIDSIAGLVGAIAWPTAVVISAWIIMRRHRAAIERLIDRVTKVGFPGGEIDLGGAVAAQKAQVEDLERRLAGADEEQRPEVARQLTWEAQELGRVRVLELLLSHNLIT